MRQPSPVADCQIYRRPRYSHIATNVNPKGNQGDRHTYADTEANPYSGPADSNAHAQMDASARTYAYANRRR